MKIRISSAATIAVVVVASLLTLATVSPTRARDRGLTFHAARGDFAQAPDGKALYEENCRKCHGVRGVPPKAIKEKFPKVQLLDDVFLAKVSDDSLVKVMTKGVGKAEDMKSFKDKMTPVEMAAVAKYVRETFGKSKGSSTL
jgi:mono/diheme cytochrome c family protein